MSPETDKEMSPKTDKRYLFSLDGFRFTLDKASLDAFTRDFEFKWSEENRKGAPPKYNITGKWSESIELKGVIFTGVNENGLDVVEKLIKKAKKMIPLTLVSGYGKTFGKFVILSIHEERNTFFQNGKFLKQSFSLKLGRYNG